MLRYVKSVILVAAGLCWFAIALSIGFFLFEYLSGGAGLQVLGYFFGVSSLSASIGLAHVLGLGAAAFLSFVIGAGCWAHGLVPAPKPGRTELGPEQR
jgi:hypothetical protein